MKFLDIDHLTVYTQKVKELINETKNETLKEIYPIDSIYLSTVDINPYKIFGFGQWKLLESTTLAGQIIYIFNRVS